MATEMTYDEIMKEKKKNIMMQRFRLVPGDKKNGKEQHETNLRFLKLYNIPSSELWAVMGKPQSVPSDSDCIVVTPDGKKHVVAVKGEREAFRVNVRAHTRIDLIEDLILMESEYVELLPEFETMDKIEIYNIPGPINV